MSIVSSGLWVVLSTRLCTRAYLILEGVNWFVEFFVTGGLVDPGHDAPGRSEQKHFGHNIFHRMLFLGVYITIKDMMLQISNIYARKTDVASGPLGYAGACILFLSTSALPELAYSNV